MRDVGFMGIYESKQLAKEAVGSSWRGVKRLTVNTFYANGVSSIFDDFNDNL